MELQDAKNPYDVFFKCHDIDESSIPERVMFDMMDLWESELWGRKKGANCSLYDVNDVACFAECGKTVKVFNSVEEIDTSKPIASVWANLTKRFLDKPEDYDPKDFDELQERIKKIIQLSHIGHWNTDKPSFHLVLPLGYTPKNSDWVLVTYQD